MTSAILSGTFGYNTGSQPHFQPGSRVELVAQGIAEEADSRTAHAAAAIRRGNLMLPL
jgi:hypothetical protein